MTQLSFYLLTKNSEKHLEKILSQVSKVADEIVVIDSGSSDRTEEISTQFTNTRFQVRPFDNFRNQRNYAASCCRFDWVFFCDSDEIPNDALISSIADLKQQGFDHEAYAVCRNWIALGHPISAIYPINAPDYPIRLFDKRKVSFDKANCVHETPYGYASRGLLEGTIKHITFETQKEIDQKLQSYTDLAAIDLVKKGKTVSLFRELTHPWIAFYRWYFRKRGCRDGWVGFKLALYAFNYTKYKYRKARVLKKNHLKYPS